MIKFHNIPEEIYSFKGILLKFKNILKFLISMDTFENNIYTSV